MQQELDTTETVRPIRIRGINEIGRESGNATMCAGRTLPWLQDSSHVRAWEKWGAAKDDVFVLDGSNRVIRVFNLISHDLHNAANYSELKNLLIFAARDPEALARREGARSRPASAPRTGKRRS